MTYHKAKATVLVTEEGVVHIPKTTPSGAVFWPPYPICEVTLPDAKLFWARYLGREVIECQDCNAS